MNLLEYQGLELFDSVGIPHPRAVLLESEKENWSEKLNQLKTKKVVLKAQIPIGKRGKNGGIIISNRKSAIKESEKLLGKKIRGEKVTAVLAEAYVQHKEEWYLGLVLDRNEKAHKLIFSMKGGVDIEELAQKDQEKIDTLSMASWNKKKVESFFLKKTKTMTNLTKKLWKLASKYEATLVEINPIMVGPTIVAGDAKVVIDDNALFRQKRVQKYLSHNQSREEEAKKLGLHYVELNGNIGVIGCGAGMVMATLDVVNYYGGKPANFLDVGGGASKEKMEQALRILATHPSIKGIFINIFGGITQCDKIAQGIVEYREHHNLTCPVVVRMIGTNEAKGKKVLNKAGIHTIDTMETGAKKIVALVNGR